MGTALSSPVHSLKRVVRPVVHRARRIPSKVRSTWHEQRSYLESYWMFRTEPRRLDQVQTRVLADLKECGIAVVPFGELVADDALWNELDAMAQRFAHSERVVKGIARYREVFDKAEALSGKDYVLRQFPENPTLSRTHPLLRLTVLPRVLDVVNHYYDMCTKLHYLDSWYTVAIDAERKTLQSQNWHRDPEDHRVVKVFMYYSDVDDTAGPLQYIPGSRRSDAKYGRLWTSQSEFYPPAEELEKRIPRSEWLTLTGLRGTMVFCDTTGFHRGGYATKRDRLFSTWTYVTPHPWVKRRFQVEGSGPSGTRASDYCLRESRIFPSSPTE